MSVTVRDFRKHVDGKSAEDAEAKREPEKPLLPQEEGPSSLMTGLPELDKLVQILEANIQMSQQHLDERSHAIVMQLDPTLKQKMTLEYFLAKGMNEAYKAIQLVPKQILAESRGTTH